MLLLLHACPLRWIYGDCKCASVCPSWLSTNLWKKWICFAQGSTNVDTYTLRVQTQLLSSKYHQAWILLRHPHNADIECPICLNASLLHPTLPYISSLNLKPRPYGCPPTIEPTQNSSSLKCSRSVILFILPTALLKIFPICSMLAFCTKVLYKLFVNSLDCPIVPYALCMCQLWKIVHVPCMKSLILTLQCFTLCNFIMSQATQILCYHASILIL